MNEPQIMIVDLGGQYTLLIARRIRELGVRSVVLAPERVSEWVSSYAPKGIILSGGWASIYDENAPRIPDIILERAIPLLGICLGMHWIAQKLGGSVEPSVSRKEYGIRQFSRIENEDLLFADVPAASAVLMSHGDSVTQLPHGARIIGETVRCPIAAFSIADKKIWGIQFHPESSDSTDGMRMLQNFLLICGAKEDWNPAGIVDEIRKEVISALPPKAEVVHLFSGGVDSTVIAAILKPVLRDRLHRVTINAGNFREDELDEVSLNSYAAGCALTIIYAEEEFLAALAGLTDAEEKRLAFQRVYKETCEYIKTVFEIPYAIQGTLATDVIESGKEGSAAFIKTHHNVGVKSLNPLHGLFKDEVREIARFLKLPESV